VQPEVRLVGMANRTVGASAIVQSVRTFRRRPFRLLTPPAADLLHWRSLRLRVEMSCASKLPLSRALSVWLLLLFHVYLRAQLSSTANMVRELIRL